MKDKISFFYFKIDTLKIFCIGNEETTRMIRVYCELQDMQDQPVVFSHIISVFKNNGNGFTCAIGKSDQDKKAAWNYNTQAREAEVIMEESMLEAVLFLAKPEMYSDSYQLSKREHDEFMAGALEMMGQYYDMSDYDGKLESV